MNWRDDIIVDFKIDDEGSMVAGGRSLVIRGILTPYGKACFVRQLTALKRAESYLEKEISIWLTSLDESADDEENTILYTKFLVAARSDLCAVRDFTLVLQDYLLSEDI